MPLQNRVTPWGALEVSPARGAWMGNRGILVDDEKHIIRPWQGVHWITCRLHYKNVQRAVFSPHTWTELFFLDEATAFAAGHRPCAYCRRARFNAFKAFWGAANAPGVLPQRLHVARIDARLHAERARRGGVKVTYAARWSDLHPGTFLALDGQAWLLWQGRLWPWTHFGYGAPRSRPDASAPVTVLTPRSVVAAFGAGLVPQVHASAGGGGPESTIEGVMDRS